MEPKTINIKASVENPTWIPVCICNGELFIQKPENKGSMGYLVLRIIDKETMDWQRSDDGIRDYYRDLWKGAVEADRTECSLSEYIEEDVDLRDRDEDPEWVPNKDTHGCDVFNEYDGLREIVDEFISDDGEVEVGTWESAGFYAPKFDEISLIFNIEK